MSPSRSKQRPSKPFLPLFLLCLAVSLIPLPPGQNVHGFVLAVFFYYCSIHHKNIKQMVLPLMAIFLAQLVAVELFYTGSNIEADLLRLVIIEKPLFLLLLIVAFMLIGVQTSMSLSALCVLTAGTMLVHVFLLSTLLGQYGYSYAEFSFAGVNLETFIESFMVTLSTEQQVAMVPVFSWAISQISTLHIVISLFYTFILARLFFFQFAGVNKSVFMAFRMDRKVGIAFLVFWGMTLSLFFIAPKETVPQTISITPIAFSEFNEATLDPQPLSEVSTLFQASTSTLLIFVLLYCFQGLACVAFFTRIIPIILQSKSLSKKTIIASLIFIIGLMLVLMPLTFFISVVALLFVIGFIDQWRDFRQLSIYF